MPIRTVNRQCSSGLQAVADVAASIRAGFYDIGQCLSMFFFFFQIVSELVHFRQVSLALISLFLGLFHTGIGAGLESMTANPMAWEGSVNPKVYIFLALVFLLETYFLAEMLFLTGF